METPSEFYINHEVRIRMLEKTSGDIVSLLRWLLGTVVVGIALPVTLHSFGWI
jgi:hypothetical protein